MAGTGGRKTDGGTGGRVTLPPMPAAGDSAPPGRAYSQPAVTLHGSLMPQSSQALAPVADPLAEFFLDPLRDGDVAETEVNAPHQPLALEDRERVLVFGLGRENYGLGIMGIREILKPVILTEVPRAPANVLGVFSLRGQVLPVLALTGILGVEGDARGGGPEARILVVGRGEDSVGFWVHRVAHVVKMSTQSLEPAPAGLAPAKRALLRGLGQSDEGLTILLDLPQLLSHLGIQASPEPDPEAP